MLVSFQATTKTENTLERWTAGTRTSHDFFLSENHLPPKPSWIWIPALHPFKGFFDLRFLGGSKKQQMSNEILLITQLYGGYIIKNYKDPYNQPGFDWNIFFVAQMLLVICWRIPTPNRAWSLGWCYIKPVVEGFPKRKRSSSNHQILRVWTVNFQGCTCCTLPETNLLIPENQGLEYVLFPFGFRPGANC